jgi:hypothetical protein
MRLTPAQLSALIEGLDWTRVRDVAWRQRRQDSRRNCAPMPIALSCAGTARWWASTLAASGGTRRSTIPGTISRSGAQAGRAQERRTVQGLGAAAGARPSPPAPGRPR